MVRHTDKNSSGDDVSRAPKDEASTLYEGLDVFLDALRGAALPSDGRPPCLTEIRAAAIEVRRPWNQGGPEMEDVSDIYLTFSGGSMRARLYRPWGVGREPVSLIYMHGGGWTLLNIDTHDRLAREYAAAGGVVVVCLDYPLAPESRYPETLATCLAAWQALAQQATTLGINPNAFVIGGDSSGANLALAMALSLRDAEETPPVGMLLNYGVYDCDLDRGSYATFGTTPFVLTRERMAWFWQCYCPDEQLRQEPLASPLRAGLETLPPAHLVITGRDVLRDENEALASALAAVGNRLSVDRYARAPHAFLEAIAISPVALHAVGRAASWIRQLENNHPGANR